MYPVVAGGHPRETRQIQPEEEKQAHKIKHEDYRIKLAAWAGEITRIAPKQNPGDNRPVYVYRARCPGSHLTSTTLFQGCI